MALATVVDRLGKAALGLPFIPLGYAAAKDPGPRTAAVEAAGLPDPEMLVRVNGAAMVLGGAALVLGIKPRLAAAGLVASLVPTTIVGHAFWKIDDPTAAKMQRMQFLKNLGMIGGLLAVVVGGRPPEKHR